MRPLGVSDPDEVGGYRVLAELGRGGMGRVLLGCGPDGRLVAVKQVRDQFTEDEGFRERFRREVAASRKVSGAYTAAVVDADADAPTPWLASVFVPGPSLREAVDAVGGLPEDSVLRLAAGLAAALAEVHRAALVHRDLKPSNVLLAVDGPRVIDFGIARATESEGGSEITHTGWLVGSPGFMSPEQAEGRELTAASDVFSLGCVLFMACTGQGPFAGPSTPQTLYNVVHVEPDLSVLPDQVRRIAGQCLAKDPADRPTPARLLEDLAGQITPAGQFWPASVHELITRQHAEVIRLLDTLQEQTAYIHGDAVTLARTRLQLKPPFDQDDDPGVGRPLTSGDIDVAGVSARPRFGFVGALASLAVLIGVTVWAPWSAPQTQGSSQGSAISTRSSSATRSSPALSRGNSVSSVKSTPTTTRSSDTEPDDGAYTAKRGDCFSDDHSSGSRSDLHRDSCVAGNFKVLKRVDGSTDASGQCEDVAGNNWSVSYDGDGSRRAMVLCTQYLYDNEVFNGQAGQCAFGQPDGSDWNIVECDRNFQILKVIRGTSDLDRCGHDVRIRFRLSHSESRTSLSVVVCMTFRYGGDGAYAKVRNCMLKQGSGDDATFVFADCDKSDYVVTGYNRGKFDKSICGKDVWHGWNNTGSWGKYLNYTTCLRRK